MPPMARDSCWVISFPYHFAELPIAFAFGNHNACINFLSYT